jgi:Arc/MetJ-type ribon-helix-helix transcriptional regulator
MQVQLSEYARQRVEQLVEDGSYPSAAAAVEAAVENLASLASGLSPERIRELVAEGYEDVRAGRLRPAEEVLQEARALFEAKKNAPPVR